MTLTRVPLLVRSSFLVLAFGACSLLAVACGGSSGGDDDPDTAATDTAGDDGSGGDTSAADTTGGDTTASDTTGGDTTGGDTGGADVIGEVALLDTALDGNCPAGATLPDTGVAPGNDLHKVTLDAYPEALCNDGSPAIMYVRAAATEANADRWVIHLQPGGGCSNYESCLDRWCGINPTYDAAKMSSKFAPEATNGSGLFSRGASNALGDANQVYVYYCSSDLWLGRKSDVVLEDPDGEGVPYRLHFRGHSIIEAALAELESGATSDDGVETLPSLSGAREVLFSGSSAGAHGITHHLDWLAAQVPQAERVGGVIDGATLPHPAEIDDPTVAANYQAGLEFQWENARVALFDAFEDESCAAAHPGDDRELCSLSTHVQLEHITTPFFVRQDLRDPVVYNSIAMTGATLGQFATWLEPTMGRFERVAQDAEEADAIAASPARHSSNCGQHIVMLNGPWFGTAAENATVENFDGTPLTVHDAIVAWITGNTVSALDTEPRSVSFCVQTTDEQ